MPILSFSSPAIQKIDLLGGLTSTLPDPADTASWSPSAQWAADAAFERATLSNYGRISQLSAASNLVSVGAPRGDFSVTDQVWDGLMGIIDIPDIVDEVRIIADQLTGGVLSKAAGAAFAQLEQVVVSTLTEVLDPMFGVVSGIPIFGTVAEIIWDVAWGISRMVQLVRDLNAPPPEKEYDPGSFSPKSDQELANAVLSTVASSRDWTDLFMPPGTGKATNMGPVIGDVKLTNGVGRRLTQTGHLKNPQYVGFIPGTGQIEQGFEVYRNRNWATRSMGQFFPTVRNLCTTVWAQVTRPSPAMYCIDAERAARGWAGHLFDLRRHLLEAGDQDGMSRKDAKAFVDGLGMQLFGWKNWEQGKTAFEGDGIDPFGVETSVPVKSLHALRDAQRHYLNQTVVAYIPEDAPAISGYWSAPYNKERWETNRAKLLTHKARCSVDLSTIPDQSYRGQMEFAKESCDPPGVYSLVGAPPLLNPPTPAPQIPPIRLTTTVSPLPRPGTSGGSAKPLTTLAILGGLAFAASRISK